MAYGGGVFALLSQTYFGTSSAASSTNGTSWTSRTVPNGEWRGIAYGNGIFVSTAGGSATTNAVSSPDGATWTARTMPTSSTWNYVAFSNNVFVAVGFNSNAAATSTNGTTWTARTLPATRFWGPLAGRV